MFEEEESTSGKNSRSDWDLMELQPFSGRRTGVQARVKKHTPHALFVHCHCHLLQLACVQSANKTPGIAHVYRTLTTLCGSIFTTPLSEQSV